MRDRMRHSASIWIGLAWLVASSSGGAARADSVPPPPTDCPPGAIGQTGHNGPFCTPKACASDAECTARTGNDTRARTCAQLAICVETRKEPNASGWSHGTPITRRFAHEACASDGACALGSCERGRFCVLADDAPPERPATSGPLATSATGANTPAGAVSKGCGACDAGGADGAAWLVIAAGLAVALRRRR
jgi:MYXO-CTERM domain-containing protein